MKQFLITMAGVFAGLVVFFIGLPVLLISVAANAAKPAAVPAQAVLELDLRDPLTDQEPTNPLASFGRRSSSVMSIIETLHRAESDDSVKGLFIRLPEGGVEPGSADELRQAFKRFRAAGKPIIAHSQGMYPSGMVTSTYMLGASSGELWMQPGASFQVTGLASEDLFLKRLFDKYGVKAEYEQRYEYKNAVNGYLYDDYTPAHRESQLSWMGSVYQTAVASAAGDRKLEPAALRIALEAGPYLAEDALRLKLIDRVGQVKEAEKAMLARAGKDAKLVELDDYRRNRKAGEENGGDPAIAVIEAEGPIITGHDGAANRSAAGRPSIPTTWPTRSTRPPRTRT